MGRNIRPFITLIVVIIIPFLAGLAGSAFVSTAQAADKWLTYSPESGAATGQPVFQADGLFARLMGVGSTTPVNPLTGTYRGPMIPSGSQHGIVEYLVFDPDANAPPPQLPPLVARHPVTRELATRFGWWEVFNKGALVKVGEYQDLRPSPFWDVDLLRSDGVHTLDMYGTGFDDESAQAGLYFYSPRHSADLRYNRFLHRLDHDPLSNLAPPASGEEIVGEDLNVGEDYVVRIQDIRTGLRGKLAKNVKYQLEFWLRRKKGERQALGTHHGAPGDVDCRICHVVNQRQTIDWTTVRVEPIIETKIGQLTVQYSRPMRSLSQNDGIVLRSYGGFHGYDYGGDLPYAVVPDTLWQTDRLRLSSDLPAESSFYGSLHRGDTRNKVRDTKRDFYGYDLRLTNRYFPSLTLNGFSRYNRQLNQLPPFLVPPEGDATSVPTAIIPRYGLRQPIDYLRVAAGGNVNWRPLNNYLVTINAGGEYGEVRRSYADYSVQNPPNIVQQGSTPYFLYFVGATNKWHPRFDTYIRYKGRTTSHPLFGIDLYTGETNSNLPEQEDLVQIGGSWIPWDNFLASASCGIENRSQHSDKANFDEDNYPITITFWYAPRPEWSISGGYGYYTNWIDQDIYFPSDTPLVNPLDLRTWNYGGRSELLSLGASYRASEQLTFSGRMQYLWAVNSFDPLAPWPDLPYYSDVIVNTTRYSGGLDWIASETVSAYVRYVYEDYDDASRELVSGSTHMFLGGLTGVF